MAFVLDLTVDARLLTELAVHHCRRTVVVAFAMPPAAYYNPRAWGGDGPLELAIWAVSFVLVEDKFRNPVPAYKHSAAMFLKQRGWIGCDDTHPQSPRRPDADRLVDRPHAAPHPRPLS